jgi:hypothetical protein
MIWVAMNYIHREKRSPEMSLGEGRGGGGCTLNRPRCDYDPNTRLSIDSVVDLYPD